MIVLKNVVKKYGEKEVLNIKDLTLQHGKIYGLVGENGAGKTTLLRILAKLAVQTSGEMKNTYKNSEMGFLIENPYLDFELTAHDNLRWMTTMYEKDHCMDISDLLSMVGLHDISKKKVKDFSLGMKQRLGIAMALIHKPEMIVLDEPLNGLDPTGVMDIRKMIQELNVKKNMTFLISSHILDELYKVATDFIFIKNGHIAKMVSMQELEHEMAKKLQMDTTDNESALQIIRTQTMSEADLVQGKIEFEKLDRNIVEIEKLIISKDIYITYLAENMSSFEEYYMNMWRKNEISNESELVSH